MKKLLIGIVGLMFLTGCVAMNGAKQGIFGGIPAVENEKGNVGDSDIDGIVTTQTCIGYLSGLHVALAVGLFVINPIIGGAYLGANAVYGFARNVGGK